MELAELLNRLRDTNAIIEPVACMRLIEEVGGLIDDLDLAVIELEERVNRLWKDVNERCVTLTKKEVDNEVKTSELYRHWRRQLLLLRQLRRHYRLLNTKLNLLIKPKGR